MSGPFRVRIVQMDCNPRLLTWGYLSSYCPQHPGFKTIGSARRAAKKYIGDGKHLGRYFADILDDNDEERSIEI